MPRRARQRRLPAAFHKKTVDGEMYERYDWAEEGVSRMMYVGG